MEKRVKRKYEVIQMYFGKHALGKYGEAPKFEWKRPVEFVSPISSHWEEVLKQFANDYIFNFFRIIKIGNLIIFFKCIARHKLSIILLMILITKGDRFRF